MGIVAIGSDHAASGEHDAPAADDDADDREESRHAIAPRIGGAGAVHVDQPDGVLQRAGRPIVWTLIGMVAAIAIVWLPGPIVGRRVVEMPSVAATWFRAGRIDGHRESIPERASTAERPSLADRVVTVLARSDVSDELKIAFLDEIAHDGSDAATDMLLRTAVNPSVLVSMAAIKGLTGRPCARIEHTLSDLLHDDEWRRRAWAAKVLGASGCSGAVDALDERSRSESEARVRDQIADALAALRGPAAQ